MILVNIGPLIKEIPFKIKFANNNAIDALTAGDAVLNFLITPIIFFSPKDT